MMIYLFPQIPTNKDHEIVYKFENNVVTIRENEKCESYDFSKVPEGEAYFVSNELGSVFESTPMLSAKKEGGVLSLELIKYAKKEKITEDDTLHVEESKNREKSVYSRWINKEEYLKYFKGEAVEVVPSKTIDMANFWRSKEEIEEKEILDMQEQILEEEAPSQQERIAMLEEMVMTLMMEG